MSLRKTVLRLLYGEAKAAELNSARTTRRIMRFSDRRALAQVYLPFFAERGGRILWIGCRDYTAHYPALLEAKGGEVWTTDIDPAQARFGRKGRHRTGDMLQLDSLFGDMSFDSVLCNGVLGHGVDTAANQALGLAVIASVLKPGGLLLLGWNTDRIADPQSLNQQWFSPARAGEIPSRNRFADTTHVYDLLVRN